MVKRRLLYLRNLNDFSIAASYQTSEVNEVNIFADERYAAIPEEKLSTAGVEGKWLTRPLNPVCSAWIRFRTDVIAVRGIERSGSTKARAVGFLAHDQNVAGWAAPSAGIHTVGWNRTESLQAFSVNGRSASRFDDRNGV